MTRDTGNCLRLILKKIFQLLVVTWVVTNETNRHVRVSVLTVGRAGFHVCYLTKVPNVVNRSFSNPIVFIIVLAQFQG